MSLNCTAQVNVNVTVLEQQALGGVSFPALLPFLPAFPFANGSGSGQVNAHCEFAAVTLAAGATATYTLSALTDAEGRSVSFSKLAGILVWVTSRTAGDFLQVGNPGGTLTHPMALVGSTAGYETVYDLWLNVAAQSDGFTVTASSADQVMVKNAGSNPITFTIVFFGRA